MNEAHNWTEFTDALRGYVVPSQNFVYADVDGHIGYYAPGRIPLRASGDGSRPADGWTGDAEWTGWVPFDELPHLFDPPEHFIVTANHRPAPPTYRYNLGLEWTEPYRAQRITDLLDRPAARATDQPLHAGRLRAHPGRHGVAARQDAVADAADARSRTTDADDQPALDSAAAVEFRRDRRQRRHRDLSGVVSPADADARRRRARAARHGPATQGKFSFVSRFLTDTLAANDSPWCDDMTTPKRETCDEAVAGGASQRASTICSGAWAATSTRWRWDTVHLAMFPHALDSVAALRPILSRSVGIGGDWSTVNVGVTAADHPYEVHTVPGYREIIDLSPANDSRFLDAVGESGHPLSPHYDDFLNGLARGHAQEDADGSRRHRPRRARPSPPDHARKRRHGHCVVRRC